MVNNVKLYHKKINERRMVVKPHPFLKNKKVKIYVNILSK